jgi:hypothetical protein
MILALFTKVTHFTLLLINSSIHFFIFLCKIVDRDCGKEIFKSSGARIQRSSRTQVEDPKVAALKILQTQGDDNKERNLLENDNCVNANLQVYSTLP